MHITVGSTGFDRQQLEDAWRSRLESQQNHYRARHHYRQLLQGLPDGFSSKPERALSGLGKPSLWRWQHMPRMLRVFTELTMHNKAPGERIDCGNEPGKKIPSSSLISVVDDDESVRAATRALLRSAGYGVETFTSAELFLGSAASRDSACLLLDIRMPGMDGLELQRRLNVAESRFPIIFVSANEDTANRQAAIRAGAAEFFSKPFEGEVLLACIEAAIKEWAREGMEVLTEELNRERSATCVASATKA